MFNVNIIIRNSLFKIIFGENIISWRKEIPVLFNQCASFDFVLGVLRRRCIILFIFLFFLGLGLSKCEIIFVNRK